MRVFIRTAGAVVAAVLSISGSAEAQSRDSRISVSRGQFDLEPFAGYMVSQSFVDGPLGTSLGVGGSSLYGVKVGLPLAPNGSLIGTLAYASGDLEAGLPILGGLSFGSSETYVYDVGVELRLESLRERGMRFVPFAQLGGGAIHRALTVSGVTAKSTDFQISGAIGADVPVMRNVALRVMAKDYWGKADFGDIGDLNIESKDLHALALTAGVRVMF